MSSRPRSLEPCEHGIRREHCSLCSPLQQQLPYSVHRRDDFPALCVEGGFECRIEGPDGYALTVKMPNALDCIREADRLAASLNQQHGLQHRDHECCDHCVLDLMGKCADRGVHHLPCDEPGCVANPEGRLPDDNKDVGRLTSSRPCIKCGTHGMRVVKHPAPFNAVGCDAFPDCSRSEDRFGARVTPTVHPPSGNPEVPATGDEP